MEIFASIPHVKRRIFERTTMNEIVLFFTFDAISIADTKERIMGSLSELGLTQLPIGDKTNGDVIAYMDGDVVVTILSSGVLVNVPSAKYRDFHQTVDVWKHLGSLMIMLGINPLVWTFTKGNRLVFTNQLDEKAKQAVLKIIFSDLFLQAMGDGKIYVEESIDKTRTLTCRYGYEPFKDKTALSLKTMITTQNYIPEHLLEEVMDTNDMMFDVWFWAAGDELKQMMDRKQ